MMLVFVFCCFALARSDYYEDRLPEVVKSLEAENEQSWQAGLNDYFVGRSWSEIAKLMTSDLKVGDDDDAPDSYGHSERWNASDLPKTFDVRTHFPKCTQLTSYIKDQGYCASSWAVSAASVMSDRGCIATSGSYILPLSQEDVLTCCRYCGYGCNGGSPLQALRYWVEQGVPTGGDSGSGITLCKPYTIPPCHKDCVAQKTPPCTDSCHPSSGRLLSRDRTYGSSYFRYKNSEVEIMEDMYNYGSVVASFLVKEDFLFYKSGVYTCRSSGAVLGGQSVRLIGWGLEKGVKYWLAANSWSTSFGENGLFKILRGSNDCYIESNAFGGYLRV